MLLSEIVGNYTNILYADKHLRSLESIISYELANACLRMANSQTLNIKKIQLMNYVIFRPQQKVLSYQPKILLHDNEKQSQSSLECKDCQVSRNFTWQKPIF